MPPIAINKDMIKTLAEGNQEVFQRVYVVFQPKVHAFALGLIKNETDADDITQLVFIKLWTNHAKLAEVENLDAYIFGITKNTVLNFIAQNRQPEIDLDCLREAKATSATGDLASHPEVRRACEQAALKSQFSVPKNTMTEGIGTVTYIWH